MTTVFVSGCYDILHAGHIQFFKEARTLGDKLIVCFASSKALWSHKHRRSSLPDEHKAAILSSLNMVDTVVMGDGDKVGLDFEEHFLQLRPDILAVTDDDKYSDAKRELCAQIGAQYHVLNKTPPTTTQVSTTQLVNNIRAPEQAPLRVDFAGGWLDVPRFARQGGHIVNCTISPLVSLHDWPYRAQSGLGGSGAYAILCGNDGVRSELNLGVGWQDPAVITETGLCVWKSGEYPKLDIKRNVDMLIGRMALLWTGNTHDTPGAADIPRDYAQIELAGNTARRAVFQPCGDVARRRILGQAIRMSYRLQLAEGMQPLPQSASAIAYKYCGGGWGGYAVYLFQTVEDRDRFVAEQNGSLVIEPYINCV